MKAVRQKRLYNSREGKSKMEENRLVVVRASAWERGLTEKGDKGIFWRDESVLNRDHVVTTQLTYLSKHTEFCT